MMMAGRPKGDVWNLVDNDKQSINYRQSFKFDFSYISSEEIKDVLKEYVWHNYRVGNKTLSTLYRCVQTNFTYFILFANTRNITSFKQLTNNDIDDFLSYLRTMVSPYTQKPLSISSQRTYLETSKSVIRWCQLHRPDDAPAVEIFTGSEYVGVNRKLKIDFIPDEVVEQINNVIDEEDNPYLKNGIIILQSTGMRIGDLMKLRIDCVKPHPINGYTMEWFQHKGRKPRNPLPVPTKCVEAVKELIDITSGIRDEADEDDKRLLMIRKAKAGKKSGQVYVPTTRVFTDWLQGFVEKYDIKDVNGAPYHLVSHQFRRTLGTDMLSQGTNINVIQDTLGHSDPAITKRFYADVKDKERAETFKGIGIIGNINQIQSDMFDNEQEHKWFKENTQKCVAGLSDGYCTKPVMDGNICPRLLKRQKCYTCSRYITTPEYLDAHKQHLANLEKMVQEGSIYGEHYAEHFTPTIEVLKNIIDKLEELQNDN